MADIGRGVKAGALAGIVAGIILGICYYAVFAFVLSDTIKAAIQANMPTGTTLSIDALVAAAMVALVIGTVIGTLIGGIILGIIFSFVEPKFMKSSTPIMKGLVFGIVLWLIGIVLDIPSFYYGSTYIALTAVFGLVGSLVFGYLLGRFYGSPTLRMQPSQSMQAPQSGATL